MTPRHYIRRLALSLCLVTLTALAWPQPARGQSCGLCGDVEGNGTIFAGDIAQLINFLYGLGDLSCPNEADLDGYPIITMRDHVWLLRYIFQGGALPDCTPGGFRYLPAPAADTLDTLYFPDSTLGAGQSSIDVEISYTNQESISTFALPLEVRIGEDIPTSIVVTYDPRLSGGSSIYDAASGVVTLLFTDPAPENWLPPGSGPLVTLTLGANQAGVARPVRIDTTERESAPFHYPLFLESTEGRNIIYDGLPGPDLAAIDHAIVFTLYSPVDMVVTDIVGDSIGIGFNTIQNGAVYDTTTDANGDLEFDDIVTIPNPYAGDYNVRIIREDGVPDSATFTLSIRIDGNQALIPDGYADASVASLGNALPESYTYTATPTLRGDANADGITNAGDIIYMVNRVFKSGPPAVIPEHGDADCNEVEQSADIIYLVNFVFKSGPPPCS